jgi:hypothetical protein
MSLAFHPRSRVDAEPTPATYIGLGARAPEPQAAEKQDSLQMREQPPDLLSPVRRAAADQSAC